MEKEIWKDIKGYEGIYQVSNQGRVISLSRIIFVETTGGLAEKRLSKRILSTKIKDHLQVTLSKEGIQEHFHVSELVAVHFLGYEKTLTSRIGFKDNNPLNCRSENLYITSISEIRKNTLIKKPELKISRVNAKKGSEKNSKPVIYNGLVYESISSLAREIGKDGGNIHKQKNKIGWEYFYG